MTGSPEYEQGLRDGKLISLEISVRELTKDVKTMKVSIYMLYGAIAVVQFFPSIKAFLNGAAN